MGAERTLRSWVSADPATTEALGEALGRILRAGDVVALDGDLGAGKTTFVRGLARGLDVTEDVSSPTFILMNTYSGRVPLYHLDAWMADRGDAFLAEGGAEWLGGEGVAVVEWAERVRSWLPADCLWVRLAHARAPAADPEAGADGQETRSIAFGLAPGSSEACDWPARLAAWTPPAGLGNAGDTGEGGSGK